MATTAKDVAALRERTGAGMMDCKKALDETNGDIDKAVELLRSKGTAKAEKRAGRQTKERAEQFGIRRRRGRAQVVQQDEGLPRYPSRQPAAFREPRWRARARDRAGGRLRLMRRPRLSPSRGRQASPDPGDEGRPACFGEAPRQPALERSEGLLGPTRWPRLLRWPARSACLHQRRLHKVCHAPLATPVGPPSPA